MYVAEHNTLLAGEGNEAPKVSSGDTHPSQKIA